MDDTISRALLGVRGVGQVQRSGGVDREIRVNLDPSKLLSLGITADMVSTQIRGSNINLSGRQRERLGSKKKLFEQLVALRPRSLSVRHL